MYIPPMVIPGNNNQNNFGNYGGGMMGGLPCCGPQHANLPCCESVQMQPQYPQQNCMYPYPYRRRLRRRRRCSPNMFDILNKLHRPRRIEIPPLPPPPPRPPRQFYKPIIQQTDPQLMKDLAKCRCKLDKYKNRTCSCENQLNKCMCNMNECQCQLQNTSYQLSNCMHDNEDCQCQLQQCMCGDPYNCRC